MQMKCREREHGIENDFGIKGELGNGVLPCERWGALASGHEVTDCCTVMLHQAEL